jgi:hypothetical protein
MIRDSLIWSEGIQSGTGQIMIDSGATLSITGGSNKGLNRTLQNRGTINYDGPRLFFGLGQNVPGVIANLTTGVINVTGGGDFDAVLAPMAGSNEHGSMIMPPTRCH